MPVLQLYVTKCRTCGTTLHFMVAVIFEEGPPVNGINTFVRKMPLWLGFFFFFQQMALNPRGSFIFGVGHGFWGHGGEYA